MFAKKSTTFFSFLFIISFIFTSKIFGEILPRNVDDLQSDQNIHARKDLISQDNLQNLQQIKRAQVAETIELINQKKAQLLAQQNSTKQLSAQDLFSIAVYVSTLEKQILDEQTRDCADFCQQDNTQSLPASEEELQKNVAQDYWNTTDIMQSARESKLVSRKALLEKLIEIKRKFKVNARRLRSYVYQPKEQLQLDQVLVTEHGLVPINNTHKSESIASLFPEMLAVPIFAGGLTLTGPPAIIATAVVGIGFLISEHNKNSQARNNSDSSKDRKSDRNDSGSKNTTKDQTQEKREQKKKKQETSNKKQTQNNNSGPGKDPKDPKDKDKKPRGGQQLKDPKEEAKFLESLKKKAQRTAFVQRFGKFYKDAKTKLWWIEDNAGHSGRHYKVYKETAKGFDWVFDADTLGEKILGKHKGSVGKFIPYSEIKFLS